MKNMYNQCSSEYFSREDFMSMGNEITEYKSVSNDSNLRTDSGK